MYSGSLLRVVALRECARVEKVSGKSALLPEGDHGLGEGAGIVEVLV